MAKEKAGEYRVVNAYEPAVMEIVKATMAEMDMCQCERCYMDACAMVFNQGYARFVTTGKGELYATLVELNKSNRIKLKMDAAKALRIIKEKPNHD